MYIDDNRAQGHDACRYESFVAARVEGLLVRSCTHPDVAARFSEEFCADLCTHYTPRVRVVRSQCRVPTHRPIPKL